MYILKTRPVSNTVMFSSIFLSVICFTGLIHVEIELHVHRQMLQVLNRQREEKLELRNTANDENESVMKMLHSDSNQGELFSHCQCEDRNFIYLKKLQLKLRKLKNDSCDSILAPLYSSIIKHLMQKIKVY